MVIATIRDKDAPLELEIYEGFLGTLTFRVTGHHPFTLSIAEEAQLSTLLRKRQSTRKALQSEEN